MSDDFRTLIYVDGGSHDNGTPQQRGYGSFLVDGETDVHWENFGGVTNNVAEYKIAIAALEYCVAKKISAEVRMDSALVVFQLSGVWKPPSNHLFLLWKRLKELAEQTDAKFVKVEKAEIVMFLGH